MNTCKSTLHYFTDSLSIYLIKWLYLQQYQRLHFFPVPLPFPLLFLSYTCSKFGFAFTLFGIPIPNQLKNILLIKINNDFQRFFFFLRQQHTLLSLDKYLNFILCVVCEFEIETLVCVQHHLGWWPLMNYWLGLDFFLYELTSDQKNERKEKKVWNDWILLFLMLFPSDFFPNQCPLSANFPIRFQSFFFVTTRSKNEHEIQSGMISNK